MTIRVSATPKACLSRFQYGTTLVGLMVGLLVSVVGILASLTLYKTLVAVAIEAKVDALHDGQLATSLLAIQLRIQNAGFGLENNSANILIDESNGQKSVYWRYKINGVIACEGLRRGQINHNGDDYLTLTLLSAAGSSCNEVSSLTSIPWVTGATLSAFRETVSEVIDFNLVKQVCSPYGIDEKKQYYMFVLSGKTAANIIGSNHADDTVYKLCLQNISGV